MSKYFLGIDTSNYKTSVAITDDDMNIVYHKSELLPVKLGQRGLRQETALFMHVNRLPEYISEALSSIDRRELLAIGVSAKPRNVQGSYMPVFIGGVNAARILGGALDIPVYEFSHQEGHIEAILSNEPNLPSNRGIVFHLSGGTTEALLVSKTDSGYDCELIGGTHDISVGQLIDRVGVKLGYDFPAGQYLDELALQGDSSISLSKVKIQDGYFNLSGIETECMKAATADGTDIVPALFTRIAELLLQEAEYLCHKYEVEIAYFAGGVAASKFIRNYVQSHEIPGISVLFGRQELSSDNAVGISILGSRVYKNGNHFCQSNK